MKISIKRLGIEKLLFESGYIIAVTVTGDVQTKSIVNEIFDLFDDAELSSLSVSSSQEVSFHIIQHEKYVADSFWDALKLVKSKLEKINVLEQKQNEQ